MIVIHTTTATRSQATALARAALRDRLAACVTLNEALFSLYHWQGDIAEEAEIGLVFKTTAECREALIACIRDNHPYDLPVISWSEHETASPAADWLAAETG